MVIDFDSLDDWLSYYASSHPKSIDMSLDRITVVADRLGLRSTDIPIVLVGGTNGKGSTCSILSYIWQEEGYKVGVFTSPHIFQFNERIRINEDFISDEDLIILFRHIQKYASDISLSYFEIATVVAMLYFIQHKVDAIILEVGMGGRLDSTNIFKPVCSVVTSIDLDHQSYLGDTREAIGFEKSGIFRPFCPAICGDFDPPSSILKAHHDVWVFGEDFGYQKNIDHPNTWNYWFRDGSSRLSLPLPSLRGQEQLINASVALTVVQSLQNRFPVCQQAVRSALVSVAWPGRFQVLPGRPIRILDVAHNPHSVRAMLNNINQLPFCQNFYAVYSMLDDKDIAQVLSLARDCFDAWYISGLDHQTPRGLSTKNLYQRMTEVLPPNKVFPHATLKEAYTHVLNDAGEQDAIIVFGSFYTVAEVTATFEELS
jgi:dihydrofolate synthase/folylpolyglutamate synthase